MSADTGPKVESKAKPDPAAAPSPPADPAAQRPYFSINEPHFLHETGGVEEGRTNALKVGILAILVIGAIAVGLAFIFQAMEKAVGPAPATITERNRLSRGEDSSDAGTRRRNRQSQSDLHGSTHEHGLAEHAGEDH